MNAVRVLLRKGANVNMVDHLGNTPLIYATERGDLEIIKYLIENGADALKKNKEGLNPIQIALHQENRNVKFLFLGTERYRDIIEKEML
jgi:ankyrin repeat protein